MKYWVYKDSHILGPLSKEDFGLAGGLRPETLVCPEASVGRADSDWRCAEDIPELAALCARDAATAVGTAVSEPDFGAMERLMFRTPSVSGEDADDGWLADILSPGGRHPGSGSAESDQSVRQELRSTQEQLKQLSEQIQLLTQRLGGPERPSAAAPAPVQDAKLTDISLLPARKASPENPPAPAEEAAPAAAVAPETLPAADQPVLPVIEAAPLKGRPRRVVKIAAAKSLPTIHREPLPVGPASAPEAIPMPMPESARPPLAPPPAAPAPRALESLQPRVELAPSHSEATSPYKWDMPVSVPPALPPAGMAAPQTTAPPATAAPSMNVTSAPATAQRGFFMAPPPAPAAAPATVAPRPVIAPPAAPDTQEMLAKLAKPQPAPTEPRPAPKPRSKTFLFVIAGAAVVLVTAGWFFLFRDTKVLNNAVNVNPGQSRMGGEASDDVLSAGTKPVSMPALPAAPDIQTSTQAATAFPAALPAASTAAAAMTAQPPSQTATASTAPAAAVVRDEGPAAVDLVKSFPLDDEHGSIGAWLQYSFMASPGNENSEKWDAGAVDESTYLVRYTVQPTGQKIREAITYLFEADVARKTVKGNNPAAKRLLAGGGRPAAKPAKPKKKRVAPKRAAPARPQEVPLAPLPSDHDLAPAAEEAPAFRSDTIQPNP